MPVNYVSAFAIARHPGRAPQRRYVRAVLLHDHRRVLDKFAEHKPQAQDRQTYYETSVGHR